MYLNSQETAQIVIQYISLILGYYMYFEASKNEPLGSKARLQSLQHAANQGSPECLSFWYHALGSDFGAFNVFVSSGGSERNILAVNKPTTKDIWLYHSYTLEYNSPFTIIFEGIHTFPSISFP